MKMDGHVDGQNDTDGHAQLDRLCDWDFDRFPGCGNRWKGLLRSETRGEESRPRLSFLDSQDCSRNLNGADGSYQWRGVNFMEENVLKRIAMEVLFPKKQFQIRAGEAPAEPEPTNHVHSRSGYAKASSSRTRFATASRHLARHAVSCPSRIHPSLSRRRSQ